MLIFLFYLIGLGTLNFDNLFNIERIFLTIFAISGLLIFQVCININDYKNLEKIYNIFLLILIFILSVVFVFYYFIYFKEWFYTSESWYLYNSQAWSKLFFNDPNIRVTGLSRIGLILLIFLITFKSFFKDKKYFYLFFFILVACIWSIQSRMSTYALPIIIIFLTFVFENKLKFNLFKNYLLIALCSIIFFEMVIKNVKIDYNKKNSILINEINYKKVKEKILNERKNILNKIKNTEDENEILKLKEELNVLNEIIEEGKSGKLISKIKTRFNETRLNPVLDKSLASSRFEIWNIALDNYNFKKVFGYGPQADRYQILTKENILKNKKYKNKDGYMTNASNALLYAFLCGGYPALITLILFYIYILYLFCLFIKKKLYLKNDNLLNCSIGVIFFLLLRNLAENSNMIYSVDFILFLISAAIFELKVSNKKN
tara:strand:- start:2415 stop:3710 length:1296 start_codon:yes stop_codon:yes gene_type:complete